MYIFGGIDDKSDFGDLWALDLLSEQWREVKPTGALPLARFGHSAVVIGSRIVIFGGFGLTSIANPVHRSFLGDLYECSLPEAVWTLIVPHPGTPTSHGRLPPPRYRQTSVASEGQLWVFGGKGDANEEERFIRYTAHLDSQQSPHFNFNPPKSQLGLGEHSDATGTSCVLCRQSLVGSGMGQGNGECEPLQTPTHPTTSADDLIDAASREAMKYLAASGLSGSHLPNFGNAERAARHTHDTAVGVKGGGVEEDTPSGNIDSNLIMRINLGHNFVMESHESGDEWNAKFTIDTISMVMKRIAVDKMPPSLLRLCLRHAWRLLAAHQQ